VVWTAITLGAAALGRLPLALWLAPLAGVAALQLAQALRKRRRAVYPRLAAAGAAAVPLAAVAGLRAVTVALVAVPVVALAGRRGTTATRRRVGDPLGTTFVVATVVGGATAAPVLVRGMGITPAVVLFLLTGGYDAGAYLVGTGARHRWEGPIAGIAAVAALDVSVAALLVPPFRGASPWVVGALVAVTAPLGAALAAGLVGGSRGRLSAVRRVDSLLLAGPAYAAAVAVLLT